jgi:outer membrane biogenesis lipoprotein LolB
VAAAGLVASLLAGCATAGFVPPRGRAVAFPDGARAWLDATDRCRAVDAYGAELRVSGRLDGQRLPSLTLGLAIEREGRMALEARYGGATVFTLRGTADSATLVQTDGRRVTTGRVEQILDALVGVSIGPARLMAVLSGCVSVGGTATDAALTGGVLKVEFPDAVTYLTGGSGRWQIRAGFFDRWSVDYVRRDGSGPRRIVLRSEDGRTPVVELSLTVVSADTTPRDPSVFRVVVPADGDVLSLDGLRERGPIARRP